MNVMMKTNFYSGFIQTNDPSASIVALKLTEMIHTLLLLLLL